MEDPSVEELLNQYRQVGRYRSARFLFHFDRARMGRESAAGFLSHAILEDDLAICRKICVESCFSVDVLTRAVRGGATKCFRWALKQNPSKEIIQKALFLSAGTASGVEIPRALMLRGGDPWSAEPGGATPFAAALSGNNLSFLQVMEKRGLLTGEQALPHISHCYGSPAGKYLYGLTAEGRLMQEPLCLPYSHGPRRGPSEVK